MTLKRPTPTTGEIYHIYNKSIATENIFGNLNYLNKILKIINFYRYDQRIRLSFFNKMGKNRQRNYLLELKNAQPLIDIYAQSFMPNHYHFLLKQLQDSGIKKFISNIQNSYAKFFNIINNREGSLFLNSFKFKRITKEEDFLHVCRYIHINHATSRLIEFNQLATYPFCSYSWYLDSRLNKFINADLILNHFRSKDDFVKFHQNQVDYQRRLKEIKDLLLEHP